MRASPLNIAIAFGVLGIIAAQILFGQPYATLFTAFAVVLTLGLQRGQEREQPRPVEDPAELRRSRREIVGAFEIEPFDAATNAAARRAAELTKAGGLVSVAGGGDTVAALNKANAAESFSFISTAGGAFLEWMEGKPLPGVDALKA